MSRNIYIGLLLLRKRIKEGCKSWFVFFAGYKFGRDHNKSTNGMWIKYLASKYIGLLACVLAVFAANAQTENETGKSGFHRLTVVMGHTAVPTGLDVDGRRKFLTLASWGLDYDYWFNENWAAGLHTDVVLENFNVEVSENISKDEVLRRRSPLSLVPTGIYKPIDVFSVLLGAGAEVSSSESLALVRLGVDFGWEITEKYEVSFSFVSDFKLEAYNSYTVGIGISRIFR